MTGKDLISNMIMDALDTHASLFNSMSLLYGLRLDVKFNRDGHP